MRKINTDVTIVGGGPTGVSTALELSKTSDLKIALFESDAELGGIPRSCPFFFGMRDMKRIYSGKAYADQLANKLRATSVDIHTRATVTQMVMGSSGQPHQISVASEAGMVCCAGQNIVIATGCFETSRQARMIPGHRPAGVFTTGSLQKLIHLKNAIPGKKAVIIGSEIISLSAVITLKKAGMEILGIVEEQPKIQTYPPAVGIMKTWGSFPVYTHTRVLSILGEDRVTGVRLETGGEAFEIPCDTIVVTGQFRPESTLPREAGIERNPNHKGPVVDGDLMTNVSGVYAAGNVLGNARMHDLCALEGKRLARVISRNFNN